jgi:hypothetical protein
MSAESVKWAEIIKEANIKKEKEKWTNHYWIRTINDHRTERGDAKPRYSTAWWL